MNPKCKLDRTLAPVLFAVSLLLACLIAYQPANAKDSAPTPCLSTLKEGDIIFQITNSPQSAAIQLATGSKYTHCGILFKNKGRMHVFEAIEAVSWTPLGKWISRGVDGHYVVVRLKEERLQLDAKTLEAMKAAGKSMKGKPYDLLFKWSDDKIYCSELVWKIYKRGAGIELSPLKSFKDYKLDSPLVRSIIQKRYGDSINLNERVVAPSDILESTLLEQISF